MKYTILLLSFIFITCGKEETYCWKCTRGAWCKEIGGVGYNCSGSSDLNTFLCDYTQSQISSYENEKSEDETFVNSSGLVVIKDWQCNCEIQ